MTRDPDTYPPLTRAERIADGILHAAGTVLAVTGAVLVVVLAAGGAGPGMVAAASVYAAALIATFVASACYHMTPWEAARPVLRRIDHAAIYLKIAGTYTPLLALLGGAFAWAMLGVIWTLAAVGAVAKLFFWKRPGRAGMAIYLALGWASLFVLWPLAQIMPGPALGLILAGGLLYSAGTIFFCRDGLRFQNAIWHGFVLAASACMFAAISIGVVQAAPV